MSAQTQQVSETGLVWWDVTISTIKNGSPRSYFCQFLALTYNEAKLRGIRFAAADGAEIENLTVSLSREPPSGAPPSVPAPSSPAAASPKKELSEAEKRAVSAFKMLPINYEVSLYV